MKLRFFFFTTVFFLYSFFNTSGNCLSNKYIEDDKDRWKEYYSDIKPNDIVKTWYLPFITSNRSDYKTLSVISTFGAKRNSYISGHIHTGLDCIPKKPSGNIDVYAMANGVVCSVHLDHPHQTVVVKHLTQDGYVIFSSYKHLSEIYVKTGDQVTHLTKIARLYTKKETKEFRGNYDHLHLEIRKHFDDFGCASWATMTKEELDCRFFDPLEFIKSNVK